MELKQMEENIIILTKKQVYRNRERIARVNDLMTAIKSLKSYFNGISFKYFDEIFKEHNETISNADIKVLSYVLNHSGFKKQIDGFTIDRATAEIKPHYYGGNSGNNNTFLLK